MKGRLGTLSWCFLTTVILLAGCATSSGSSGGQERTDAAAPGATERVMAPPVKEILPEEPKSSGGSANISVGTSTPVTITEAGRSHPEFLDVPFDFDQHVLRPDALVIVEANARRIKEDRPKGILLEGRGDEIGTTAYNLVLGERRASRVKRYLEQLELTATSIDMLSYGKDRPLCLQHDAECRQKNRSVRFTIVK